MLIKKFTNFKKDCHEEFSNLLYLLTRLRQGFGGQSPLPLKFLRAKPASFKALAFETKSKLLREAW